MMTVSRDMKKDGFEAYFDAEASIARVVYPDHLTPDITRQMYKWFGELAEEVGMETLKGCIFDFRGVSKFHPQNARAAQTESRKINARFDLSKFPVAFLVRDMYQEQMLRVSMRITQNSERLRVIHDEAEAVQYITRWPE